MVSWVSFRYTESFSRIPISRCISFIMWGTTKSSNSDYTFFSPRMWFCTQFFVFSKTWYQNLSFLLKWKSKFSSGETWSLILLKILITINFLLLLWINFRAYLKLYDITCICIDIMFICLVIISHLALVFVFKPSILSKYLPLNLNQTKT